MIYEAEKLLDDFRKLPGRVERPRTFMEIAGYPHYENVCSNILAFFMDPKESHGLGTLVLDALASASGIATADEGVGGNVSVEREVRTAAGNRIDILITSDNHATLLENKIYANVNNPFDDYVRHLDLNYGKLIGHKILLTVFPTSEGSDWGFRNLTYEEFVEQIRSRLGHYISDADTRHLTMFLDFLNTLENLHRGTRMNEGFVKLLAERSDDIENFFADLKNFRAELREKVQELRDLIEVEQHTAVEQDILREPVGTLSDVLYQNILLSDDLPVAINTAVSPHGWEIKIFVRRGGNRSKLRELLERLGIPFEEGQRFIYPTRFAYDENLDQISLVLQDLIDKIATSQKHEEAR